MVEAKPAWHRIRHVLLDMDGTILDLGFDAFFWHELVPQRYAQARDLTLADAHAELGPKFRAIEHTLPWYCMDHWSAVTGLDLAALKHEVRHRVSLLQGALDFLHAVRASGRELWLVTNAHPHSWRPKLEQTGLQPLFDRIVSSHDHGAPKEDARFWQALQALHPFDPAAALFADDSLPVLAAARAHGIAELVAIRQPDSQRPLRSIDGFPAVDGLASLLPLIPLASAD